MCSELLRIPISWHGIPIFGIGVLLLVWSGLGVWTMAAMARDVGWGQALKAHLPTLAIVGLVIAVGVPRMLPEGVPVRSYGVLMLAGIIGGIWLSTIRAVQAGLDAEEILGLALWVIPGGAIGGRADEREKLRGIAAGQRRFQAQERVGDVAIEIAGFGRGLVLILTLAALHGDELKPRVERPDLRGRVLRAP